MTSSAATNLSNLCNTLANLFQQQRWYWRGGRRTGHIPDWREILRTLLQMLQWLSEERRPSFVQTGRLTVRDLGDDVLLGIEGVRTIRISRKDLEAAYTEPTVGVAEIKL